MIDKPDSALVTSLHPSPNIEPRRNGAAPNLLILHYTGMRSTALALDWLSRPESRVSCHYVVNEEGVVTQMVAEAMRAWHAGVSCWAGERDINSASIGIEIQNPGHDHGYQDFSCQQLDGVIELARDIVRRHGIRPERVLAHSDIAPGRKIDPGEKLDWGLLGRAGVGHWAEPVAVKEQDRGLAPGSSGPDIVDFQRRLAAYGYDVPCHGRLDERTANVVRAFQLHFRPGRTDGRLDRSTIETLDRLSAALAEPMLS